MRLREAMARKVMPILSDFGFSMSFSDKGCYQFENCQEHSNITFEIPPGCPPSLYAEYVERMRETGQTGLLPRLTTSYGIRHRRAFQWSYLLFNSSQLHSCGDFFYSTQDELDSKLQQVAYEYVSTIHPYMVQLIGRYVYPTREMYNYLAQNTKQRALDFAVRHQLPMKAKEVDWDCFRGIILKLREGDENLWIKQFTSHLEDLIPASAYLGEVILNSGEIRCGEWMWNIIPPTKTAIETIPEIAQYLIKPKTKGPCNPLYLITEFWNYYPRVEIKPFESYLLNN